MRKSLLIITFAAICSAIAYGQEKPKFDIKFSGFVKTDIFWDSRQTVSVREGHFLLYPQNEKLDLDGKDINDKSNFNILSIQTRCRADITGPDALGAKTSGAIEGEFFGTSNGDVSGFRLRHAFVKLKWLYSNNSTELMVGQFWHPMFPTSCYPGVVSFNTGAPFTPFSRNPQIRIIQQFSYFKIMATAFSQRDFVSYGPDGASSKYLRNTAFPALNLRFEYDQEFVNGQQLLIGVSSNFKVLTPRLVTNENYKTDKKAPSFSGIFYAKYKIPFMTFKIGETIGQDVYNLTMVGGYAVEKITNDLKGFQEYTPIYTYSTWADIHTNRKDWQVGLFLGYSKNLGANTEITNIYYSRGWNIDYLYRISGRFMYNAGKFRIAPEIEYTVAAYGNANNKGEVENSKEIGNLRVLLGVYYFFKSK